MSELFLLFIAFTCLIRCRFLCAFTTLNNDMIILDRKYELSTFYFRFQQFDYCLLFNFYSWPLLWLQIVLRLSIQIGTVIENTGNAGSNKPTTITYTYTHTHNISHSKWNGKWLCCHQTVMHSMLFINFMLS